MPPCLMAVSLNLNVGNFRPAAPQRLSEAAQAWGGPVHTHPDSNVLDKCAVRLMLQPHRGVVFHARAREEEGQKVRQFNLRSQAGVADLQLLWSLELLGACVVWAVRSLPDSNPHLAIVHTATVSISTTQLNWPRTLTLLTGLRKPARASSSTPSVCVAENKPWTYATRTSIQRAMLSLVVVPIAGVPCVPFAAAWAAFA
eukprot:scaffold706_cov418-Prasinococcus_capsulatus_cf.AAC.37